MGRQVFESSILVHRGPQADVLPHGPQALAVHVRVDPARVRILARPADVPREVAAREILRPVDRLDRNARVQDDLFHDRRASLVKAATTSGSGVPIGKTRCTPPASSASTSRGGMKPPPTTLVSHPPRALRPSSPRRGRGRWGPARVPRPRPP